MNKSTFYKIALLVVAILWGAGFPVTKIALESGIAPNALMSVRFLSSSILILIFLKIKKIFMTKDEIKLGIIAGIILGLAFSLQTIGLKYTTPSKNAFITGVYIVIVPFFTWIFSKNPPKKIVYLSTTISFLGILVLSFDGNLSMNYGDLLTLFSAFFFALQLTIIEAKIKGKRPLVLNGFQMLSAGILTLFLNIFFEDASILTTKINLLQISAIIFLVLFNTFLAYLIQMFAQKYLSATTAVLILSTEILFGALTSIIFMNDTINLKVILGGILIFTSVLLSELKN